MARFYQQGRCRASRGDTLEGVVGTEASTVRWWVAAALAAGAYLFWLDGLYIPHIGDEAPYIEIARLTSESGQWLPLRTGPGLENTKPPLLFWMGMAATRLAGSFSLLALRLPIVAFALATALLAFVAARALGYSRAVSAVASLTFLGFFSSFQYGRPFLVNLPETFFVFLSFVLLVRAGPDWTYGRALGVGAALGTACLFKSFALVGPGGLGLAAVSFVARDAALGEWMRRDVPRLVLVGVVALACFALWPLADPDPGEVLRHFVLEENLGKLPAAEGGYLGGLIAGPYPLYRIWLGPFANAGLFAPMLLAAVWGDARERRRLGRSERQLWLFALSFLVVYSLPSQRQENYLLPIMPALAILIARRWETLGDGWLRASAALGLGVAGALFYGMARLSAEPGLPEGLYTSWQLAVPRPPRWAGRSPSCGAERHVRGSTRSRSSPSCPSAARPLPSRGLWGASHRSV